MNFIQMDTVFTNSENSKTLALHRPLCCLEEGTNLKRIETFVALTNLTVYYTGKAWKRLYKKNKFKLSALTWDGELELPNELYSISDT